MTNSVISKEVVAINAKANQTADALSKRAKAALAKANKTRQAALLAKTRAANAAKAEKALKAKAKAKELAEAKKIANTPLHVLRMNASKASTVAYGALKAYSYKLTLSFGEGWTEIPLSGPASDNELAVRSSIKAEKVAFQANLKSEGHSNPSKAWGDVVRHAKDDTKGEKVVRGPLTRIQEGIAKIYKDAYNNWEKLNPQQREGFDELQRVCVAFGIDFKKLEG
jgi:hypothetical protein